MTNRVAVWMLFHPHSPPKLFGRPIAWLQGAIPKNQDRLAHSVGKVVGGTLLNSAVLPAVTVMTERRMLEVPERSEAYRDYQQRTSVWLPWLPR